MRYIVGFIAGVLFAGLMIDRGVNLPERLGRIVNTGELQELWKDVGQAVREKS
jgi:hypothetical protein